MAIDARTRYQPCRCKFFNEYVWAILTKQKDGSWKTVNCLDKHDACLNLPCTFTSTQGEWPYSAATKQRASTPPAK
jgi:hypothetical protein